MHDPDIRADVLHALVAFLAGTFGWMLLSGILTAAFGSITTGLPLEEAVGLPHVMGFGALVQTVGIGALCVVLARSFRHELPSPTAPPWLLAGLLSGLTVGFLPGWLAGEIRRVQPSESALDTLADALHSNPVSSSALLVFAICVAAPIAEEVAFRGFVWGQLRRLFGPLACILLTSGLFLAYHLDPIQSPSLLPTALLFGVLRWRSGSLVPSIAAHFANNAVAMTVLFTTDPDSPPQIPLSWAFLGTIFSWVVVGLAWRATTTRT